MSRTEQRPTRIIIAILLGGAAVMAGAFGLSVGAETWQAGISVLVGAAALIYAAMAVRGLARRTRRMSAGVASALSRTVEGEDPQEESANELPAEIRDGLATIRSKLVADERARNYLDRLLAGMNEALLVTDGEDVVQRANAAAAELFGCDADDLLGTAIAEWIAAERTASERRMDRSRPREANFRRKDGSTVCVSYTRSELRDESGEIQSRIYAAQNIDDRKKVEQRIRYLARVDSLTKIANRMQFQHLLQQAIARAKRNHRYLALLYLDVDRFKDINDTFGHAAGDTSLEMFARRISDVLTENSTPGRLAGDEFCVLLVGGTQLEELIDQANQLAGKLLRAVSRPFDVQGEEIFMSTSIGVAIYPRDGDNVIDLLRNADAAMYQAKKAGGNCYEYYNPQMNSLAEERLKLKSKLRRAFERDELRLHYQPKYRLSDGRISGVEALVRWDQPEHGLVFPSDFIPLAEETNLILQIGEWVLDRVCSDYRSWQRIVPSPCRVSVNLSLRQLQQQRFLEGVRKTFRAHAVSPACLELEITETTLMENTDATIRILDALYGMGLHLAIDDFGTGYSSLSALQQFPINTLKIDQSFVRDIAIDPDNAAIVRTIIQMGHSLKLEVIAEGVESQEQLEFLRRHGCDSAQGHLFGDPMSAAEFGDLLTADADGSGRYRALFA